MPRPKKLPLKKSFYQSMTGAERLTAIAELLALGIVRLASREEKLKKRDRTGLKPLSKRFTTSTQTVDIEGKRHG